MDLRLFLPCSADGLGCEVDGCEVYGPGPTGSDESPERKEKDIKPGGLKMVVIKATDITFL